MSHEDGPDERAGDERAGDAVDPDIDLLVPAQRAEVGQAPVWPVLSVISAGGALGASARYGAQQMWPTPAGAFPWTVFWVNVLGCALIGVLMVLVAEGRRSAHPLVRPFLGVGVLGGFTTFSTYALDVTGLLERGAAGVAVAYAAGTLLAALAAVWAAAALTRRVLERGEA